LAVRITVESVRNRIEVVRELSVEREHRRLVAAELPDAIPLIGGRTIHPAHQLLGGSTPLNRSGTVVVMGDGLEMLHYCDAAVRNAQVFADLARVNLADDAWGYRGDDLRRMLADVQQHLQRLRTCIEGDIRAGVA
jgi:hypothetical protein